MTTSEQQANAPWTWYYARNGKQYGPVSSDALREALGRGEVGLEAFVWSPGMREWRRAADVAAVRELAAQAGIVPPPLPHDAQPAGMGRASAGAYAPPMSTPPHSSAGAVPPATSITHQPHPWRRWGARMIDTFVAGIALLLLMGMADVGTNLLENQIAMSIAITLFMIPFEATCIALWQQTAGKALLNIHVRRSDGRPLSWSDAARRTWSVVFEGMALGFPIIALITTVRQYNALSRTGAATYDRELGYLVSPGPISGGRLVVVFAVVAGIVWLIALGSQN